MKNHDFLDTSPLKFKNYTLGFLNHSPPINSATTGSTSYKHLSTHSISSLFEEQAKQSTPPLTVYSRTVGRSALHGARHTRRLFAPTFPIDTMSARHPESAALSPWRFSALIKSSPANTLFATRTRVFDPYGRVPVCEDEGDC